MCRIEIQPGGLILHAKKGASLREILLREGLFLDFPCGGWGRCGQCRVKIAPPTSSGHGEKGTIPESEAAAGTRLACMTEVEGDCTVILPEGERETISWHDPAGAPQPPPATGSPVASRRLLKLPPPTLEDQRADWERIASGLHQAGLEMEAPDWSQLEDWARILRDNGWEAEAVLEDSSLLCLLPVPGEPLYGFAVDLGTTTVDVSLHVLESGRLKGRRVLLNRQAAFGADVISRVQRFQEDRRAVRKAALDTIREAAAGLLQEHHLEPRKVARSVVVGNPVMIHILHDLDPGGLAAAPYIPLVSGMIRRRPEELGFGFQGCGFVESLPLVSAFVGADTVGVILALDLEHEPEASLAIDIGTNGEIVLARAGELLATSTAAGPAFEGAQIACGMRAASGAIFSIGLEADGEVSLETVEGAEPRGLCGSGLISGVAALLEAGLIDSSGRLLNPEAAGGGPFQQRLRLIGGQPAFMIAPEQGIYLSQKDVRELQLAKGAIRTGIDMLLERTGVSPGRLARIRLAGNFGSGLEAASAIRLGLIPKVASERVDVVGNAALRGAALSLVSRDYRERARTIGRRCRFLELANTADFSARFAEAMIF